MSADFLSNFMRAALSISGAERGVACDVEPSIVDLYNIEQSDVLSDKFPGLEIVRQALATGEPILTNNAVNDLSQAPVTNTNYSNLRVIVVIPLAPIGAIYLDQLIRKGIFPKEMVARLGELGAYAISNGLLNASDSELVALYENV
ncbi:MAG: hypothetical protein JNJ61_23725 [Anaerolineae bacterium]|nr:hypothetical protein [Anaerolineae bacterium]